MRVRNIRQKFHQFLHECEGTTAVIFVLSLPIVVGFAGLGVETGYWYLMQRKLQTAADITSYVGAIELRSGANENEVVTKVIYELQLHGYKTENGAITVNIPPQSGNYQNDTAVEVLLTEPIERMFSRLYSQSPVILDVRAVSSFNEERTACVLALDPWASTGVIFAGNPSAIFSDCNIVSNSLADKSITISGSADVTVPCIISAGGTAISAGLTLTECTAPIEGMSQIADPYDNLAEPAIPSSCSRVPRGNPNALKILNPGRYCGGLTLTGDFKFNPGVYVISGGDFRINGNSTATGSGVVFYLTNGATVRFNGNAAVSFSAPTTGTYAGILAYGDRDQQNDTNIFNGTVDSSLTGSLYFPTQEVQYNGNLSGQNGCLRIVARTIDFQGNANFGTNCSGTGIGEIKIPSAVRMVE